MARKRGLQAAVMKRLDKTLDNADEEIDATGRLVAELIQEILDGVTFEIVRNGTKFGVKLIPKEPKD